MLLRVAIDPYAGLEVAEGKHRPGRLLARHLRERCLLVADSGQSLAELLDAFRRGGSVELAAVIEQLANHRYRPAVVPKDAPPPVSVSDIDRVEDVATWREIAHLLLLSQLRIDEIGHDTVDPEVSTMREAHNSDAFDEVESRWAWTASAGTSRDEIWAKTFGPLAAEATHLYLIDGFLLQNLYERMRKPPRDRAIKKGVEWFAGKVARSRVQYVNVLGTNRSLPYGVDAEQVESAVQEWWSREFGPKPKLDVRLISGDFPHGRRIAFDGWAGYELHKGLSTFDSARVDETVTLHASLALAHEVRAEYRLLAART
jgi:hypothetical protein